MSTEHRVHFINLADHLSPAPGRDALELVLSNPGRKSRQARLFDLSPMGVGVEALTADHQLALIRDMGGNPGNELQVVHSLLFFGERSRRSAALCSLSETGADGYSVKKTSYILCPPPT